MKLTYYGQSCFQLETKGKKIVFDPFITDNPLAKDIDVDAIEADYILVSHGHSDHTGDLLDMAKRTEAKVVTSYEIKGWLEKQEVDNVHPMNTGGEWEFDFGKVLCVVAQHSSSLPDGTYAANPMGFVIWNEEGCVYFAGDTALTLDMKLIPLLCPPLSFAILPIGDNFTMGVRHAVFASNFIKCNTIVGCHYDTFGYIEIDHDAAKKTFEDAGKKLILPEIGKKFRIEPSS